MFASPRAELKLKPLPYARVRTQLILPLGFSALPMFCNLFLENFNVVKICLWLWTDAYKCLNLSHALVLNGRLLAGGSGTENLRGMCILHLCCVMIALPFIFSFRVLRSSCVKLRT